MKLLHEKELILASASPRRRELMNMITNQYRVVVSDVDESALDAAMPAQRAQRLAKAKCQAVAKSHPDAVVIGCDTVVELRDALFEKPVDVADARRMITALADNTHVVHTGVCIAQGANLCSFACTTAVTFSPMTAQEIEAYIHTDEPYDKAGGYGIQGSMAKFVEKIDGCYYNVMGLPVSALYRALQSFEYV